MKHLFTIITLIISLTLCKLNLNAQEWNKPVLISTMQSNNDTNNIKRHFNTFKYQKNNSSKSAYYVNKQTQLQNITLNKKMKLCNHGNFENTGKTYNISNNSKTDNALKHVSSPLISGVYYDIVTKNNTIYAVNEWGIMIFDVTEKTNPLLVNSILLPITMNTYIDLHNNYLFVSGGAIMDTTYIYDISTPHKPDYLTGFQERTIKSCIKNNILFLQIHHYENDTFIDKLKIFEISNIKYPKLLSEIENVKSFDLSDNYLYTIFSTYNSIDTIINLKIYDITNTTEPVQLNEIELIDNNHTYFPYLLIEDNFIYIEGKNNLHILNIEAPIYPEIESHSELSGIDCGTGYRCIKYNNYLYLKGGNIVDVSDPESPEIAGDYAQSWPPSDVITDIYIQDGYLYVTNWEFGFYISDLTNLTNPELCFWYDYEDYYHGIYKKGNYAYLTSMNGFTIIDVSDPENGEVIGTNYDISWGNDILVEDDYAYVVSDYGLTVFDVKTPENPLLLSSCWAANENFIKKDTLIFAVGYHSLSVHNVKDSYNIQLLDSYNFMLYPWDLCIKDNYLFVADWNFLTDYYGGLRVIDISDPNNLELIATNNPDTTRVYRSIEIKDNYVFMGGNEPGIYVFDISNPLSPTVFTYIDVEQNTGITDMEIQGDSLYTTNLRGKYIFDISNIDSIKLVSYYPGGENNCCWSISVDGEYIYEASSYAFNIYKLKDSTNNSIFNCNYNSNNDIFIQNYPNPFENSTTIKYKIPKSLKNIPVSLNIYNINGQLIKTLFNNQKQKGGVYYEIIWNGNNNTDRKIESGIYIIKFDIGDKSVFKKMLLIK
ncbi:MAG: T9SS type A sorting domain-containing protein [Bacteroidales bacterium]|nr:T9SS type A sorting domain-containing protein [Bacteroidales bacterium]